MSIQPVTLAVAGGTGSGKTTIVNEIVKRVGAQRIGYIQHDSYYYDRSRLPLDPRGRPNFDHPEALETDLLIEHLTALESRSGGRSSGVRFHHRSPPGAYAAR